MSMKGLMGFDVEGMAHKIAHPFQGKLEQVEAEIKETNKKLDKIIKLLEQQNSKGK